MSDKTLKVTVKNVFGNDLFIHIAKDQKFLLS
jgi:hypothetical protein